MSAYAGYKPAHEVFVGKLTEVNWATKFHVVAVGDKTGVGGVSNSSTNVVSWSSGSFGNSAKSVAYGKGSDGKDLWLAGGSGSATPQANTAEKPGPIYYSRDGVSWSSYTAGGAEITTIPVFGYLKDGKQKEFLLDKNGKKIGRWMRVTPISIWSSSDGFSWSRTGGRAGSKIGGFVGASYANGLFFAGEESFSPAGFAGSTSGHLHVSRDGRSWSAIPIGSASRVEVFNVAYGNGVYVVAGSLSEVVDRYRPFPPIDEPVVAFWLSTGTSSTGFNWGGFTPVGQGSIQPPRIVSPPRPVAFGNGRFVLLGLDRPYLGQVGARGVPIFAHPYNKRILSSTGGAGWGTVQSGSGQHGGVIFSKGGKLGGSKQSGVFVVASEHSAANVSARHAELLLSSDGTGWQTITVTGDSMSDVAAKF